jgi:hypothetical protein
MKMKAVILMLALAPFSSSLFAGALHLTTDLSADFLPGTSARQIVSTFAVADQPVMWGFGWEIVPGRLGFGGEYLVSFAQEASTGWWLDWYAPALALAWHPVGGNRFLDPFFQAGLGAAGRVHLTGMQGTAAEPSLSLALFPFVAGGLNVNLDGLLVGVKGIYTPFKSAVPVTNIPLYPLGDFQVTVSAGVSVGW